jgi:hypothetical protein
MQVAPFAMQPSSTVVDLLDAVQSGAMDSIGMFRLIDEGTAEEVYVG